MGGFGYPDEFMFENEFGAGAAGAVGIFFAVFFVVWFLLIGFSIVCYVLNSLGLFTIAERRGIRHAWLAWVPYGSVWILGSISDQYQYVAKGKVKNRRKVLLGLNITYLVVYIVQFMASIVSAFSGDFPVLPMALGSIAMIALIIVQLVMTYVAYNDLYNSCKPDSATTFLVLSIVFSVTLPFFVFACRKKDLGMPPRKQAPVQTFTAPEQTFTVPEQTFTVPEQTLSSPVAAEPIVEETEEGYAQPDEFVEE